MLTHYCMSHIKSQVVHMLASKAIQIIAARQQVSELGHQTLTKARKLLQEKPQRVPTQKPIGTLDSAKRQEAHWPASSCCKRHRSISLNVGKIHTGGPKQVRQILVHQSSKSGPTLRRAFLRASHLVKLFDAVEGTRALIAPPYDDHSLELPARRIQKHGEDLVFCIPI